MPRKHKPRKPVASLEEVWIAPRPAKTSELRKSDKVWVAPRPAKTSGARTIEPTFIGRSNRYLEFADIALGAKNTSPRKKKPSSTAGQSRQDQDRRRKVTSIDGHKPSKQGFGAFRNSR